jgi:ABC-type uncharacterized transport system permease subunit
LAHEAQILMTIMFFMAFLGFMSTIMPPPFRILSPFDFLWFGGGMVGVAGACNLVPIIGVPCTIALAIFTVVSILLYVVIFVSWIKALIFIPLVMVMVYLVSRLARGGG